MDAMHTLKRFMTNLTSVLFQRARSTDEDDQHLEDLLLYDYIRRREEENER